MKENETGWFFATKDILMGTSWNGRTEIWSGKKSPHGDDDADDDRMQEEKQESRTILEFHASSLLSPFFVFLLWFGIGERTKLFY